VQVVRPRLGFVAVSSVLAGIALTILASFAVVHFGLTLGIGAVLAAAIFICSVIAYLWVPHLAVTATIPLFAFVPMLKVFVNPNVGAVKDVVSLAAITAGAILITIERRRPDRWIAASVAVLLALYVIDVGHPHNTAWAQGVRLTAEPLLLLLVGLVLPHPRRNLRYALISLIATGCVVAFYGLLQQLIGPARLVSLGYSYDEQVRTAGSSLRSFGTLDDPFDYAAFLLFALGAVLFWLRRGSIAWAAGLLILLGLGASFVRTAALVLIAFLGMQMLRWRQLAPATFLVAAALVISGVTLVGYTGTQTTPVTLYTPGGQTETVHAPVAEGSVAFNGRISAWTAALGGNPFDWVFGRGVGKVGTAAARATYGFSATATGNQQSPAVDSGYFATMADVGLIGMLVELAMFGRLLVLGSRSARAGSDEGWAALALIVALMLYALTRAAFTGFPTAFLDLLVAGIAVAAATEPEPAAAHPRGVSRQP
jgi:hypothetical protein